MISETVYNDFILGNNADPLVDLLIGLPESTRICTDLLDRTETFDDTPSDDRISVKLEDKLRLAYDAIFNNKDNQEYLVGKCAFSNRTKKTILKASNLLSEYAIYDNEWE